MKTRFHFKSNKKITVLLTAIILISMIILFYVPVKIEFSVFMGEGTLIDTTLPTVQQYDQTVPVQFTLSAHRRIFRKSYYTGTVKIDGVKYTIKKEAGADIVNFLDVKRIKHYLKTGDLTSLTRMNSFVFMIERIEELGQVYFTPEINIFSIWIKENHLEFNKKRSDYGPSYIHHTDTKAQYIARFSDIFSQK